MNNLIFIFGGFETLNHRLLSIIRQPVIEALEMTVLHLNRLTPPRQFSLESAISKELLLKMLDMFIIFIFIMIAFSVVVSIFVFVMFFKNAKNIKELKENKKFIREIIIAQEDERRRISMELHDNVIQNMKAINLLAKNLASKTKDEDAKTTAEKIAEEEKQNQKNLRKIVQNLYTIEVENVSIKSILVDLYKKFSEQTQIETKFYFSPKISERETEHFSDEEKYHIARIVQESLLNAKKYSEATEVCVSVQKEEDKLKFMVFDNGKGFDCADDSKSNAGSQNARNFPQEVQNHFGISGMQMRAKLLGGNLTIKSFQDVGTEVCLEIN